MIRSRWGAAVLLAAALPAQDAARRPPSLQLRIECAPARDAAETEFRAHLEAVVEALGDAVEARIATAEALRDPDGDATRLRYECSFEGRPLANGSERHNGLAHCHIQPFATCPHPLLGLVRRFGYEARTGWLSIDVPTVTGNLANRPRDGGPLDAALMLAGLACGELALFARQAEDRSWQLTARSDAGLLLPTLLMLLDTATATGSSSAPVALGDDLDRWLLIARAAHAAEREEALRQLARFADPRAIETLERVLFDPQLKDTAALALAHLGTPEALAALSRHAERLDPALVANGVWTALPEPVRDRVTARIRAATPTGERNTTRQDRSDGWFRDLRSGAVGLAVGLLLAWLLVARRTG